MIAFGPITSRRLGLSLGINNIVSQKRCSYSCVYCQIGNTINKLTQRSVFYNPEQLFKNVKSHLNKLELFHKPDYLTFVSNGEPTLDINLGKEIQLLKQLDIPVAVITNASLIDDENVRNDLLEADWVSVKIDTIDKNTWKRINKPVAEFHLEKILEGIQLFTQSYKGVLNTETMLVEDYNDAFHIINQTARYITGIKPDKAYLSIPTRPPANKTIKAVSEEKITEAWKIFRSEGIETELIIGFEGTDIGYSGNAYEDILNITAVHPLRKEVISELVAKEKSGMEIVNSLVNQGLIKSVDYNGNKYYVRKHHH